LNKCISPIFLPLNGNTSPKWIGYFPPLVGNPWIKSTNASVYFSNTQRALKHGKKET
jgi:hypothetical protein